jgi:CRISPR-associated protein Cas2
VQNSVFECQIDPTQWSTLKLRLLDLYNPNQDSFDFIIWAQTGIGAWNTMEQSPPRIWRVR